MNTYRYILIRRDEFGMETELWRSNSEKELLDAAKGLKEFWGEGFKFFVKDTEKGNA